MDKIKLLIEEQQELLREAYQLTIAKDPSIELVELRDGSSIAEGDTKTVEQVVLKTEPDILLLGTTMVQASTISTLQMIQTEFPQIGIVLLSSHFDAESIGRLKGFAGKSSRGAYLLKGSVNTGNELIRAIHEVSEGRVIVDAQVFAGLMRDSDIHDSNMGELTARELEVLGWLSMGYTNAAIAQAICVEPKTVERHISSIYSKLNNGETELKHPRVGAAIHYFKATGQLQSNGHAISSTNR